MKLCDIMHVLNDKVSVDFYVCGEILSFVFSGKKQKFLETFHYQAFQTNRVVNFNLTGDWMDGYTAQITCMAGMKEP